MLVILTGCQPETRLVEMPVEVEVTRVVEMPVEVEVSRVVEMPVEVEVTRVVEIGRGGGQPRRDAGRSRSHPRGRETG